MVDKKKRPLTPAERMRSMRKRKGIAGKQQVNFYLFVASVDRLDRLCNSAQLTRAQMIERLINAA